MWQPLTRIVTTILTTGLLMQYLQAPLAAAGIYRDKNGKLHISDTLPVGDEYTIVKPSKGGFTGDEARAVTSWDWVPVPLPMAEAVDRTPKEANAVFETANKSVWTVLAAESQADLERRKGISQGSAVAVSKEKLLTNCHVVKGRPYIVVQHAKTQVRATVVAGDAGSDRCVLAVAGQTLQPVPGYRTFDSLAIGEQVYTIGSPHGLENTLGQGIISGRREAKGYHLVQTTAQVSPGSSGGGLFDLAGNLIGITTFKVRDSDGLNFAIAVEDFTR
jgi:serine protease Do